MPKAYCFGYETSILVYSAAWMSLQSKEKNHANYFEVDFSAGCNVPDIWYCSPVANLSLQDILCTQ